MYRFHHWLQLSKATRPQYLLFFVVHYDLPEIIEEYFVKLNSSFNGKKIFVSGDDRMIGKVKMGKKMQWMKAVEELENELSY